jgi:hypothetical protein
LVRRSIASLSSSASSTPLSIPAITASGRNSASAFTVSAVTPWWTTWPVKSAGWKVAA